jgi:hypothetical protein
MKASQSTQAFLEETQLLQAFQQVPSQYCTKLIDTIYLIVALGL